MWTRERRAAGAGRPMTICIIHEAGTFYTYADDVLSVLNAIESGAIIETWWVTSNGQRFKEDCWFDPDKLLAVRTERDDG